jgi:hypothetical protein
MISFEEAYEGCRENWRREPDKAFLYLEHMRTAYDELDRRHRWISVKERLPEKGKFVLAFTIAGHIEAMRLETQKKAPNKWALRTYTYRGHIDTDHLYDLDYALCWMPLPKPPERVSEE